MLQTQTVVPDLLELLEKLMKDAFFDNFILVGGTSLALQLGHRNSVDIDLFGNQSIDKDVFEEKLKTFGITEVKQSTKNIFISSVKRYKS